MFETVLVCGGRNYANRAAVFDVLNRLEPEVVIHGAARGADSLAAEWVQTVLGVEGKAYPAYWKRYGRGAGPTRNQLMLDDNLIDLVVVFPGGRGTGDMKQRAFDAKVPVLVISE